MSETEFAFPGDRVRGGRGPDGPTPEMRLGALEGDLARLGKGVADAARRAEAMEARLATLEAGLAAARAAPPKPALGVGAVVLAALSALVAAAVAVGAMVVLGG